MLDMFFSPESVAVIGASRDTSKLGYGVLHNVIRYGYAGPVYPINPKADEILGLKAYPSVLQVPGPVDLAVIVVPSRFVAVALEECGQKGVRGAIIITAGFREVGSKGKQREQELLDIAKRYNMRLVGPNVLGVIDTTSSLNASFAAGMPRKGTIAFMSQSGALCTSILDMALADGVGFSHFVSLGNKADTNEVDFLQAWQDDPDTRVVMAYLEGIVDGEKFMDVARKVNRQKPIVAIKSGTTSAGSRAVSSHTGTLAGSERAYDAAFNQVGIIRAQSIEDLFDYSVAFARQPLPKKDYVAVVTNAGGPGIMAADAIERAGLKLARLMPKTQEILKEQLPAAASAANPIDVLGDSLADRYELAVNAALSDPNVGAVVVLLTPQVMTEIEETAQVVGKAAADHDKPVMACFMGAATVGPGVDILNELFVPNYRVPERAIGALAKMSQYRRWLEQPPLQPTEFEVDRDAVRAVFDRVKSEGRVSIGDAEAREIMVAYGIPMPQSVLAKTSDDAVEAAERIGYPVVMKIASPDILHKTDIGGVKLNLATPSDVRDAFDLLTFRAVRYQPDAEIWGCLVQQQVRGGKEIILGMSRDPQFGPLLIFGLGGIYVEALKDVTFRVAPIDEREAREMMAEIRSYSLLRGVRGEEPSDMDAIVETVLRVSQLVTDFPEIVEMDINPLIVFEQGKGALGIDMRLVLT